MGDQSGMHLGIADRWETGRAGCKPHAAAGPAAGHNRRPLVGQKIQEDEEDEKAGKW